MTLKKTALCDDILPATNDLSQPPRKAEKIKTQFNTSDYTSHCLSIGNIFSLS